MTLRSLLLALAHAVLLAIRTQFDTILGIALLDNGTHLEAMLKRTGDMVGSLASLHRTLYTAAHTFAAEYTYQ